MKEKFLLQFLFLTLLAILIVNCGGGGGGGGESQETTTIVGNSSNLQTDGSGVISNNGENETQYIPPPSAEKTVYVIINPSRAWNNYNATVKIFNLNSLSATICKKDTSEPLRFICPVLNLKDWYLVLGILNNSLYLNIFSPVETEEVELNQETTQEVLEKQIVEINNETIEIKNTTALTEEEEEEKNNLTWNFLCY